MHLWAVSKHLPAVSKLYLWAALPPPVALRLHPAERALSPRIPLASQTPVARRFEWHSEVSWSFSPVVGVQRNSEFQLSDEATRGIGENSVDRTTAARQQRPTGHGLAVVVRAIRGFSSDRCSASLMQGAGGASARGVGQTRIHQGSGRCLPRT
jgi:hypothetical protein